MGQTIRNMVTETILERRSVRAYLNKKITEAELNTVLEAGIWAPTARNQQEIEFYVLKDRKLIDQLSERFSAFANKDKVQDLSFGAPVLILLYGKEGSRFMTMDAGIAVENMAIAAQSLGLSSVIVGCFKEFMESEEGRKYSESIGVPESFSFCISIAIGYGAESGKAQPRREGRICCV